jgi:uncharacterized membrane protein
MIRDPIAVLCVLLGLLAVLFVIASHARYGRIFKVVPLLVFAYFVPTLLSNTGVIPLESPLYSFIRSWLLPASSLCRLTAYAGSLNRIYSRAPVDMLVISASNG